MFDIAEILSSIETLPFFLHFKMDPENLKDGNFSFSRYFVYTGLQLYSNYNQHTCIYGIKDVTRTYKFYKVCLFHIHTHTHKSFLIPFFYLMSHMFSHYFSGTNLSSQ